MALRYYKNSETEEIKRSLKKLEEPWIEMLVAPDQKYMVKANAATGKSKIKDAEKVLKERSRNHSRNVGLDDTIQKNLANGLEEQVNRSFLNNKGEKRRKIDDI